MILIADDDKITRALVRLYLKDSDNEIIEAANGKETIDALSDRIDTVLLDLHMPEVSGMECLRYINKHYTDISTIVITASSDVQNAIKAMKIGAFDYVVKPLERDALNVIVHQAVKMARQAKYLKKVETELAQARKQEISIASKIQQALLRCQPPLNLKKVKIAQLAVASQTVDGDFFEILNYTDNCFDLIIGDVMGKGFPAALLGAAVKSHLMRVNNELMQSSRTKSIPDPRQIVTRLHTAVIDKLVELDTFVTLWYCRFDLETYQMTFVDCGHMRTIHFQSGLNRSTFLKGKNMPLGFPEKEPFQQIVVPFKTNDLFFFYSDGLTEAKNSEGIFFGESRVLDLIGKHVSQDVESLLYTVWKNVISFTRSEKLDDDFTSVAIKINENNTSKADLHDSAEVNVTQDIHQLDSVRCFIQNFCRNTPNFRANDENIEKMEQASQQVVSEIIRYAYKRHMREHLDIKAALNGNHIVLQISGMGEQKSHHGSETPDQKNRQSTYFITDCIDNERFQSEQEKDENGHAGLTISL